MQDEQTLVIWCFRGA